MPKVLFLIQDSSFTYDNRVRREAATLRDAGFGVSVICTAAPGEPLYREEDGIHVYRFQLPRYSEGFLSHLGEYAVSIPSMTALAAWVYARHGFDVIHAANPPDLMWMVAAPYKARGVRFVFDHHDLVPELFEYRFKGSMARLLPLVRATEQASFRLADHVISTNETYRRVAIERGGRAPDEVTVVRNGPRLSDFPPTEPDPRVRDLGRTVVGYLGYMNPQDGVDLLLEAARIIRLERGREDVAFVLVGGGDSFDDIRSLRDEMGLTEAIHMTGRIPWDGVLSTLAATDLCVQPDPPVGLNDHSTMNKLMEYMALGKPAVAFPLTETRVSGGDAAVYARGSTVEDLVEAILSLVDDPERRAEMGRAGRKRVEEKLSWQHQSRALLEVYRQLFPNEL